MCALHGERHLTAFGQSREPLERPGKLLRETPVRRPEKLPLLDAICKKLNQRVNLDDEQRVLGLYERGWIFKGVLGNLNDGEARYVRALATRYGSWIARQVA